MILGLDVGTFYAVLAVVIAVSTAGIMVALAPRALSETRAATSITAGHAHGGPSF